jgi:hydroxymethylpyrimidine pyrophosphatase-like HAD family hydrolase
MAAYHRVLELSRAYQIPFEVYTAEGSFYRETAHPDLMAHQSMLGFAAEVQDLKTVPGQVIRVQFVSRPSASWQAVRAAVLSMPGVELHEATSPGLLGVGFNSVTASGVSKRAAAEWVAAKLDMSLANCAMIGDGENDLELIQSAGLGIAMGNAPDLVKQAADLVVRSVDECGLEQALDAVSRFSIQR